MEKNNLLLGLGIAAAAAYAYSSSQSGEQEAELIGGGSGSGLPSTFTSGGNGNVPYSNAPTIIIEAAKIPAQVSPQNKKAANSSPQSLEFNAAGNVAAFSTRSGGGGGVLIDKKSGQAIGSTERSVFKPIGSASPSSVGTSKKEAQMSTPAKLQTYTPTQKKPTGGSFFSSIRNFFN
jgi:hypothetical protein